MRELRSRSTYTFLWGGKLRSKCIGVPNKVSNYSGGLSFLLSFSDTYFMEYYTSYRYML